MFGQDFEVEVDVIFIKILKLALVKILSLRMLMFGWDFEVNA